MFGLGTLGYLGNNGGIIPVSPFFRGKGVGASATSTFSVDLGNAQADRYIVVAVGINAITTATTITVTAAGTSLNQDINNTPTGGSNNQSAIFSGLVTAGSGAQNVVVTTTGTASLGEIEIFVWRLTGLTTNAVKNTGSGAGNGSSITIAVASGDFVFTTSNAFNNNDVWNNSTVPPNFTYFSGSSGAAGEWEILATNASFNVTSNAGFKSEVVASYH